MPYSVRVLVLAVVTVLLTACPVREGVEVTEEGWLQRGREAARDTIDRAVALEDRALVLDIARGSVTLTGTDVDEARLAIARVARAGSASAAAERLQRLQIDEVGATDRYEFSVAPDRARATEVHVEGTVPRGVELVIRLGRGDVRVTGLTGGLDVLAENGEVVARDLESGQVRIETIRGHQTVSFIAFGRGAEVRLLAENGDLGVALPPNGSAEISVEASVGSIAVHDLPLSRERLEERRRDTRYRARLGDGHGRLVGTTAVGDVHLRAAPPAAVNDRTTPGEAPAE